ncbi:MAG: hypothetical protein NUV58_01165, partial [Candidatus Roizmanbacteria bacterium]|nr:hypothetical protein [Candidatus Roizmanbacteria bacterium]
MNGEKSTQGLDRIIAKLEKYHKESSIDIRSNNIWRRIRSYSSPEDAKKELNKGLLIYSNISLGKEPLQDKSLYQQFETTINDKSNLHPMEESDIKTHYSYHMDGTSSKKFQEKTISYLKQYCEDVVLSSLLYNEKPRLANERQEIDRIKMIMDLLEDGKHRNFFELGRRADKKILPAYIILKTLKDRSPPIYYFSSSDVSNTRKTLDNLFGLIDHPGVKKIIMKKFISLEAPKIKPVEPIKTKAPLELSKDYEEIKEAKRKIIESVQKEVLPDSYEMKKVFFSLTPFFYSKGYQEIALKSLKKLFGKRLRSGEVKKIALSLRDTYKDISSSKGPFKKPLDESFEKGLQNADNFLQLDKVILKTMFDKYQNLNRKKGEYYNFMRLPGMKMAIEALRKAYLLSNLKGIMKEKDKTLDIFPNDSSILSNTTSLREMFGKTKISLFNSKDTDQIMDLLSDEDIGHHWVFHAIDNLVKDNRQDFKQRKIIKTGGEAELELNLSPDVLFPKESESYFQVG